MTNLIPTGGLLDSRRVAGAIAIRIFTGSTACVTRHRIRIVDRIA